MVTFNRAGKLDIVAGLARREDISQTTTQHAETEGEGSEAPREAGLTQSHRDDIGQYRQQISQATLLKQPAAAMDVLYYALCMQVLAGQGWLGKSLQSASIQRVISRTTRDDTGQGRAFEEIEAHKDTLALEWLCIEDAGERFVAFRDLAKRAKEKLVTFCTALTLTIGLRGSAGEQDRLVDQPAIAFADYWRPTRDNYFNRVKIEQMKSQFGPMLGQDWLGGHCDAKKSAIVDSLHDRFGEEGIPMDDPRRTWLPEDF